MGRRLWTSRIPRSRPPRGSSADDARGQTFTETAMILGLIVSIAVFVYGLLYGSVRDRLRDLASFVLGWIADPP